MGSIFSVADLLDMVRRRIVVIGAVTALGCVLSLAVALSQVHLYSSTEVLQLQNPKIATDLAPTTISGSSARRLQLIEQQVMARGAVLETIEALGLFADEPGISDADRVAAVRRSVRVEGVAAKREGYSDDGTVSLLRITATWPSAEGAQALAHEFSLRTVELSTATRLDEASGTLAFFERQEEALRGSIADLEAQIAAFRADNDLSRPGEAEATRREIEGLNLQMVEIDRQIIALQRQLTGTGTSRVEQRQREEARMALEGLTAERSLLQETVDDLSATLQGSPEIAQQLERYERRMLDLRQQLQTVAARRKEAEIALQLEVRRQAERLTVLEPAPLPDYPETRSRKQIAMLGAFASLLAGLGVAFVLDLRNPVLRSAAHMEHYTGLRPVVSIPEARPQRKRKARRRGVFGRLRDRWRGLSL